MIRTKSLLPPSLFLFAGNFITPGQVHRRNDEAHGLVAKQGGRPVTDQSGQPVAKKDAIRTDRRQIISEL
jgi:hypothetical protein